MTGVRSNDPKATALPHRSTLSLCNEAATEHLGHALARAIAVVFVETGYAPVLHLSGDLGAGKTTLIRALLRSFGISGRIKSPTFALVEPYEIEASALHGLQGNTAQHMPHLAQLSNEENPAPFLEAIDTAGLYSAHRNLPCYHFDFYRFTDTQEWLDAGFREYFDTQSLCLVEWPEKAGAALPPADLHLQLQHQDEYSRVLTLVAHTARGLECLTAAHS